MVLRALGNRVRATLLYQPLKTPEPHRVQASVWRITKIFELFECDYTGGPREVWWVPRIPS